MKTVIIKYNAGNIQSVLYALERIGVSALVTDSIQEIQTADKVIFPGVGEASSAMQYLRERNLDELIKNLKQPVLGICLGMQLKNPILVGFGIKDKATFDAATVHTQGAIIGSAYIQQLTKGGDIETTTSQFLNNVLGA